MPRRNPQLFDARVVGRDAVAVSHGTLHALYIGGRPVAYGDQGTLYFAEDAKGAERRAINKWANEQGFGTTRSGHPAAREDVEYVAARGRGERHRPVMLVSRGQGPSRRQSRRRRNPEGGDVVFDEPGCYIDGARGREHAVSRMRDLLGDVLDDAGPGSAEVAAQRLSVETFEEEFWEEFWEEWLDDAIMVLQSVTREGLVWDWEGEDLCLAWEESG